MLKGMSSSDIWEKILENEEDAKKVEESFKRMDEHTKNFHVCVTCGHLEPTDMLMQSSPAWNCVED